MLLFSASARFPRCGRERGASGRCRTLSMLPDGVRGVVGVDVEHPASLPRSDAAAPCCATDNIDCSWQITFRQHDRM